MQCDQPIEKSFSNGSTKRAASHGGCKALVRHHPGDERGKEDFFLWGRKQSYHIIVSLLLILSCKSRSKKSRAARPVDKEILFQRRGLFHFVQLRGWIAMSYTAATMLEVK